MSREFGKQGWRSERGESARLPPMWPGFNSRRRRHKWVEFVVCSLLLREVFLRVLRFSPLLKKPTLPNSNAIWNAHLNEFI